MVNLESYSNLTKLQEDLLKKGFCFDNIFSFSLYSKNQHGLNHKASYKQKPSATPVPDMYAYTSFEYKNKGFSIKEELETTQNYKTTFEYVPESRPEFKGKLEMVCNTLKDERNNSASVEYSHERVKSKFTLTDTPVFKASAVTGIDNFGAGVDLGLNLSSLRFTDYNAALWWFTDDHRFVLKHASTNKEAYELGNIIGSLYYNLSQETKLGAALTYKSKAQEGNVNVGFGLSHQLDSCKLLKLRMDSEGMLGVNLRSKLSDYVTIVTASQFNVKSLSQSNYPGMEFGFKIKINQ